MVHSWKDKKFSKLVEELYGEDNRLISFFFTPETKKVLKVKEELDNEAIS